MFMNNQTLRNVNTGKLARLCGNEESAFYWPGGKGFKLIDENGKPFIGKFDEWDAVEDPLGEPRGDLPKKGEYVAEYLKNFNNPTEEFKKEFIERKKKEYTEKVRKVLDGEADTRVYPNTNASRYYSFLFHSHMMRALFSNTRFLYRRVDRVDLMRDTKPTSFPVFLGDRNGKTYKINFLDCSFSSIIERVFV